MMSKNPKQLAVLNTVAEKADYAKPLPKGTYRGICQNAGFGSYCAAVAEVSVSDKGKLTIQRIVAVTDPGYAVNPDQIDAQVAGSFAYGLSAALYSENTIKDGRVVESNFDSYEGRADGGHAEGRNPYRGLRRLLGRRRRADHRGRHAGGAQRDLRGDRQARPQPAAEAPDPGLRRFFQCH